MEIWRTSLVRAVPLETRIAPSPPLADPTVAARVAAARNAHKSGWVVLHGTALVDGRRALCLLGPSSSGKSTVAAILVHRGLSLLSEGMAVVSPDEVPPRVYPGPQEFRLWDDAIERLGATPADFPAVSETVQKRRFPAERASQVVESLTAVYVLEDGKDNVVEGVYGARAAQLLVQNLYLEGLLDTQQLAEALMACARIAGGLEVRRVIRRKDPTALLALAERILSDARELFLKGR